MTITNLEKDRDALTMTVTAQFAAPVDRVWNMWSDPRLLEQWWGPPEYPVTVVNHDLTSGGVVNYFMTGPDGDKMFFFWNVTAAEAPTALNFDEGFADEQHEPDASSPPIDTAVTLSETSTGTAMTILSTHASTEAMEMMLEMGAEEAITFALGQLEELLNAK